MADGAPKDDGSSFLKDVSFWNTDNAAGAVGNAASGIGEMLGGAVGGGGATASGGADIAMSTEEMRTMLTKAKSTRDLIKDQITASQRLARVTSPADEPTSNGMNGVITQSGNSYLDHLSTQANRYTQLIQKLEKALGLTVEADQDSADAAKQAGKPVEGEFS